MSTQHTPEPWPNPVYYSGGIATLEPITFTSQGDACMTHADANRTVQCVNACAGIADPAAALEAARDALEAFDDVGNCRAFQTMKDQALKLLTPSK